MPQLGNKWQYFFFFQKYFVRILLFVCFLFFKYFSKRHSIKDYFYIVLIVHIYIFLTCILLKYEVEKTFYSAFLNISCSSFSTECNSQSESERNSKIVYFSTTNSQLKSNLLMIQLIS